MRWSEGYGCLGLLAAATTGIWAFLYPVTCQASPWQASPPTVIAHAGGDGLGPDNTIETMERSLTAGADMLELDLRMSLDGVIVARHDRDVATTTDGVGFVDELTWAQLHGLDAAAGWGGPALEASARIPSLEEILIRFPEVPFSIELKRSERSMARAVCDVLERTGSVQRVHAGSNGDDALYEVGAACTGLLITTTFADRETMGAADEGESGWCAASPIEQIRYAAGLFDADSVATAHRRGTALFVWTVDDPAALRELAAAGVDAVYTRRPDIARAVFDEAPVVSATG